MSWLKKFLPIGEERRQGVEFGFQVLKNSNKFVAIDPWFDFICGINGRLIEDGNSYLFSKEIENCAGRDVPFMVWSAKGQRTRDVMVSIPSSSLSLGLILQWCPIATTEEIWHILDVAANSPADMAGLLPYSDYIIGASGGILYGESSLGELVEGHLDRQLLLYVYNHEYDVTRELYITPTRSWGGSGALGCVLGYGALHRIPAPLHEPVQAPGETLFTNSPRLSQDLLRPAIDPDDEEEFPPTEPTNLITPAASAQSPYQFTPMDNPAFRGTSPAANLLSASSKLSSSTPPPPPRTASAAAKLKPRHAYHFDASAMDNYLKEGEQKSMALEGGGGGAIKPGLPPPPKRTGPPPPQKMTGPAPQQVDMQPPPPATSAEKPENESELD